MDLLSNLNNAQIQAVTAKDGPILVLAGPGSGKTSVLTRRIAYLIDKLGVRSYQILAVTFTNKASKEMESRLQNILGFDKANGLFLGTFHSICVRILRREADHIDLGKNFVIFDADDQISVIKSIIKELNINDKLFKPSAVHSEISKAKNELIMPDDYPIVTFRDETVKKIYMRYQTALHQSNGVDFDDLLLLTTNLFSQNQQVLEKYSSEFKHILVDEFQDTNMVQYQLIQQLSSVNKNVFCVGDPDQSVYRWRGADYRNVANFEKDHPSCETILLEQNYRSKQTILDAAMAVIDRNPRRKRKQLFSNLGTGEQIQVYEAFDDKGEASFIVDTIKQMVSNKKSEYGDFAVMYRTNAMSRLIEETFIHSNVPYRLVGAQRFYGRREVKDFVAYLRLVQNRHDEISLGRVINVPARGIGDKTLEAAQTLAKESYLSTGEVLLNLASDPKSDFQQHFKGRALNNLIDFGKLLVKWQDYSSTLSVTELFDQLTSDIQYESYLDDGTEEGQDRWDNILELRKLTEEYNGKPLNEFLENIALVSDQDTIKEGNVPTLLTLHAAKGLEFKNVFIMGLDDGILPHSRSFNEPEEMEEERRLFYVGITRAKDRLFLVRASSRAGRGFSEDQMVSRFLRDIPESLVSTKSTFSAGVSRPGFKASYKAEESVRWASPTLPPKKPVVANTKYRPGMRVKHNVYGEGMVIGSRVQNGDEIVDIIFETAGAKKLDTSLAKLTILS